MIATQSIKCLYLTGGFSDSVDDIISEISMFIRKKLIIVVTLFKNYHFTTVDCSFEIGPNHACYTVQQKHCCFYMWQLINLTMVNGTPSLQDQCSMMTHSAS